MKNILVLLAVLSAATLSFAGEAKNCADTAKCADKSDKACCCKADKATCADKAKCTDKSDQACCCKDAKAGKATCADSKAAAKPATTAEKK